MCKIINLDSYKIAKILGISYKEWEELEEKLELFLDEAIGELENDDQD